MVSIHLTNILSPGEFEFISKVTPAGFNFFAISFSLWKAKRKRFQKEKRNPNGRAYGPRAGTPSPRVEGNPLGYVVQLYKSEENTYHLGYGGESEAKKDLIESLEIIYNPNRVHSYFGYTSPKIVGIIRCTVETQCIVSLL